MSAIQQQKNVSTQHQTDDVFFTHQVLVEVVASIDIHIKLAPVKLLKYLLASSFKIPALNLEEKRNRIIMRPSNEIKHTAAFQIQMRPRK